MKSTGTDIKKVELDQKFYFEHKDGPISSEFGLDGTNELIDGAFGLYSTVGLKKMLGPVKTEYYRIGFVRSGTVTLDIGLETYRPQRDSIVFGFPGQTFSLYNQDKEFFAYYILFRKEFMDESLLMKSRGTPFPFLTYNGMQSFSLDAGEAGEVESLIMKINREVQSRKPDAGRAIALYIQLILLCADRSCERQSLAMQETADGGNALFKRFIKLVNQHFLTHRKVADYANLLHVSADHLNRTIKAHSEKTAHELIDEMILIEAKAHLLHTDLSVAEIAYRLEFTDPSHFNKFFRKRTTCTPLQFRNRS